MCPDDAVNILNTISTVTYRHRTFSVTNILDKKTVEKNPLKHVSVIHKKDLPKIFQLFYFNDLILTQDSLQMKKIEEMVKQGSPKEHLKEVPEQKLPKVFRVGGINYLIDGHHRATWHHCYNLPFLAQFYDLDNTQANG